MRVMIVPVEGQPYPKNIENNLESLQKEVGGYIEPMRTKLDGIIVLVNEEGALNQMENPPNPWLGTFGQAVVLGTQGEEFTGLTTENLNDVMYLLQGGEY